MRTVGEILKTSRERKNLSLPEVASATKIKKEFLEAIENNQFQKVPSPVSVRGFIKNYAEFLGLSPNSILAIFKRDFVEEKKEKIGFSRPAFTWTPQLTAILVIVFVFLAVAGYLLWQYFSLKNNPY